MRRNSLTARAVLTTTLALLATTAPAAAQVPLKPDERAAANAFADAALTYTRGIRAAVPAARSAARAAKADRKRCSRVTSYVERLLDGDDATRGDFRAVILFSIQPWVRVYSALVPAHERMLAELDAVPTADPALRTGRAVWRSQTNQLRFYAGLPTDLCAQLAAWVDAGAKGTPLPHLNLRDEDDPAQFDREPAGPSPEQRLARAAERLRALGQGPRRAARFTGDAAFAPLEPLFREVLRIE